MTDQKPADPGMGGWHEVHPDIAAALGIEGVGHVAEDDCNTSSKMRRALEAVLRIDTGNNRTLYGNDFEAGMAKALWLVRNTIIHELGSEEDKV